MAGSYRTMLLSCLFLSLFSAAQAAIPPCNPGTYSDIGYMPCTQCPAGTFASNYGTRSCTAVPAGYASCPAGQSSCIGSNTLYPCALGTYASVAGSTSCTVCPAGYTCANVARDPVACPAGTYSPSGARSCTSCPQGTTSTSGSSSCHAQITCGAGSYLDTLTNTCVTCQPGTFLSSATCAACPAGHSCAGADAAAVECPAGTFSQAGQSTCIACDTDTISSAGSSSCTFCPTGTAANADKSACVAPTVCGPGAYPDGDDCLLCSPGYYCPGSNSPPLECPANTWSEGGDSYCSDCGNGMSSVAGSSECTELACTIGYYPDLHTCSLCPAGSYCPNPAGEPTLCTAGTYALAGSAECLSCPTGYTSAEGATFCVVEEEPSCGDGFYMDQGTCSICPAGSACSDNLLTQCTAGTYSEENAAACTPCADGYTSDADAAQCTPCADGYTSDADAAQCTPEAPTCTAGEYLDTMTSTCKTCPAGFACPSPDSDAIQGCLAGTFSFAGQTRCTECGPGTTSAALASSCTPILPVCSAGQYTAAGNLCTTCPAGYACPDPSASAPTACTPGTYSTSGQTSCTACPGPTISEAAASSCHVAPAQPSGGLTKRNEPLGLRALCAFGSRRCPVPGLMMGLGYTAAYECVDVRNDLESCGGCVYNDSPNGEVNENGGRDCSAIPGVESVRCVRGMCVVDSCRRGFFVGGRSASCEAD